MKQIKVAIVDDDISYRTSLKDILRRDSRIHIYREYEKGADFIRDIDSPFKPDVCLIDIKLGDISGIECARIIKKKNPFIFIIIMTAYPDVKTFTEARKIGVDYIEKNARSEYLFKKIILSSSSSPLSRNEHLFFLNRNQLSSDNLKLICELEEAKKRCTSLSNCQIEILKLKKTGKTVKEISQILGVHQGTIGTQLFRIYEKLNLPDLLDYL